MQNTQPILRDLYQIFDRFEELLATKTEPEITAPSLQDGWSIQDVIGHLRAWQQVSIARLEAGNSGGVPVFPDWLQGHDPEEDDDADDFNARIHMLYHTQPWDRVHTAWRDGFRHFLALGESIAPDIRSDRKKFPWLRGYSLDDVLYWSGEHHQEHLDALLGIHRDARA